MGQITPNISEKASVCSPFFWPELVNNACTREIQTNAVTARRPMHPKASVLKMFSKELLWVSEIFVSRFWAIKPANPDLQKESVFSPVFPRPFVIHGIAASCTNLNQRTWNLQRVRLHYQPVSLFGSLKYIFR